MNGLLLLAAFFGWLFAGVLLVIAVAAELARRDAVRHDGYQGRWIRTRYRGRGGSEYELVRADDHRGAVR